MYFTEVHPNDALASESQQSQALAESRRLWILENAPSDYQRMYPSDADNTVHSESHIGPTRDQWRLPGIPHDGKDAAQLQVLPTPVYPNDALPTSETQPSHALAESRRLWILKNAPSDYQKIYSSDADGPTPVHFQFGSMPFTFCQQCLAGLPQRGESEEALLPVFPTQVHPNDPPAYSHADTPVHFQFGSMPFTFCQQCLAGAPYDGESPAHPQVWESKHPNDTSQLSPLGVAQSTGGAQEQSPGTAQLAGVQEAEPHQHSSVSGGEQYTCSWENCFPVRSFTRPQDLARHVREVHDSDSPRKCPLCPPDKRAWKRPYLLKDHLIDDHYEEFGEDDIERIRFLKGRNVFVFVDTIEPLES